MSTSTKTSSVSTWAGVTALGTLALGVVLLLAAVAWPGTASAAQPTVNLGTASSFAVLAGSTVTNTGASTISGDLGVYAGTAITGFPPGTINGTTHATDGVAQQAQSDLTTAYVNAANRTPVTAEPNPDLTGQTLAPGIYSAGAMGITGTVTLDGQGNPNAVFIFQAASTLITGSGSHVALIGSAQPCNVFWQVTSSATLGTNSSFVGTIMALTSATANTGATVQGRILARNGQVALDDNTITVPTCTNSTSPSTTTPVVVATTTPGSTSSTVPGSTSSTLPGSTSTTAPGSPTTTSPGSSTTTTTEVLPTGAPPTGRGGAAQAGTSPLVVLGSLLAALGLGMLAVLTVLRRRATPNQGPNSRQG